MKVDWWWLIVAFAVAWFWSRQREQNLVAENSAQWYQLTHPASSPPAVADGYAPPPGVPGSSFADKLRGMMKPQMPFKGTIIA